MNIQTTVSLGKTHREKIITVGRKRIREYTTIDHFPNSVLYRRIYSLFERLRKENVGSILFEGPFKYRNNKTTFLVGISKMEPEIGGFGGAIIFLCDLTGYLNYLSDIKFYEMPVAFVSGTGRSVASVAPVC